MVSENGASRRSLVLKAFMRQKRGYVGGDSYMETSVASFSSCQCAAQASGCPAGPPGPAGQPGMDL